MADTPELLDHPLIGARYFFPGGPPPQSRLDVEVDGATLACGHHVVDPEAPTVIYFHGNGETVADWQGTLDRFFNDLGWNLLLAEYRGYGGSTGRPLLATMLDDVGAVVRAAGDPARVVVFGRSVGSIFALEAVARFPQIAGLILESGIADPLERLLIRVEPDELGVTAEEFAEAGRRRLDHAAKIGSYAGPVLIMHTRHDGLVPVNHAQRLAAWAGDNVTTKIFPTGDHNSILMVNAPIYLRAVRDFLEAAHP